MAKIPVNTFTTKNIIENAAPKRIWPGREYLSMSGIGDPCSRKLFYNFRWASPQFISPKLKRIFNRGDIEEERIISELREHGIETYRLEGDNQIPMTGKIGEKQEELSDCWDHEKGHPDGRVIGVIESPKTPHLLEMKTMNDSRWKNLVKLGVKLSDPKYFAQVQRYMRAMKLNRTLFIATNKNNEDREYQRIELDIPFADSLKEKAREIILSIDPPIKQFSRSWFECKTCQHFGVCHDGETPEKSCRNCEHADLIKEGKWVCTLAGDKVLTKEEQIKACHMHKRSF